MPLNTISQFEEFEENKIYHVRFWKGYLDVNGATGQICFLDLDETLNVDFYPDAEIKEGQYES